ncbi:MAG: M48 family metalloprotease [Rhodobacteraceae bacterium]|nr:M48 family metalloprotease [Paracoccaceae bacterium]
MTTQTKFGLLFAAIIAVAGCGGPVLDINTPSELHQSQATEVLARTAVAPARNVRRHQISSTVDRVAWRVRAASHSICIELQLPYERCEEVRTAQINVETYNNDPNAYADLDGNIGLHGGLVRISGSDDEIAAVLAHEFAHVMYGHVDSKMNNTLVGMTIGAGLASAFAENDPRMTEGLVELGGDIGSTAYSVEMEVEADRTAIYILKRAGFRPTAMRDTIVRLSREDVRRQASGMGSVGFLQTHPSNDWRVAHILSAIEDAEYGVPLIIAVY